VGGRLLVKEVRNSEITKVKPAERGVTDPSVNIKIKSGKLLLMQSKKRPLTKLG